jgi:hypothetical protein
MQDVLDPPLAGNSATAEGPDLGGTKPGWESRLVLIGGVVVCIALGTASPGFFGSVGLIKAETVSHESEL